MHPFSNILKLSIGDALAKALYFFGIIYVARTVGVEAYGSVEFALAVLAYMMMLADGGLEIWATREVARGRVVSELAARILPIRMLFAALVFAGLLVLLPKFPEYPQLESLLILVGLSVFANALSLKWAFLGREQLARTGKGLVVGQLVFAVLVFAWVREPGQLLWFPVARLIGDFSMTAYFGWQFGRLYGVPRLVFSPARAIADIRPALVLGATQTLGIMNYNFAFILLGFLAGPAAVGIFGAAYKPVTVALAVPLTCFVGLFPVLSRTFVENHDEFRSIVARSLAYSSILAVPIGILGGFLAGDLVTLLYGAEYSAAAGPLRLLCWSAVLVILRGTFRQSLNAAGHLRLDLAAAAIGTTLNICLNLVLAPRYGADGAAIASLASDWVWLLAVVCFYLRRVDWVNIVEIMIRPVSAGLVMVACMLVLESLHWAVKVPVASAAYFMTLVLLKQAELTALVYRVTQSSTVARVSARASRLGT